MKSLFSSIILIYLVFLIGCSPTPAPEKNSTPSINIASIVFDTIDLINDERKKANLPLLKINDKLNGQADHYAKLMASKNILNHNVGSSFQQRVQSWNIKNLTAAGENIAMGYSSPQQVVRGWMNSPGHRANILNRRYNITGMGLALSSRGQYYWCQEFAATSNNMVESEITYQTPGPLEAK